MLSVAGHALATVKAGRVLSTDHGMRLRLPGPVMSSVLIRYTQRRKLEELGMLQPLVVAPLVKREKRPQDPMLDLPDRVKREKRDA